MKNRPTYTRPNNRVYNDNTLSLFKITPRKYPEKEHCQSKNFEKEFARLADSFGKIIGNDVPAKQPTDNSTVCEQNRNMSFFFNENRQGHIELLNSQLQRLRQKIDRAKNKN